MSRIEMLKGYDLMRERADHISDESTRAIFASGVETMSDSSINQLPKTESIKRMIRVHKNGPDRIINSASASEINILERYRVNPKGEPFLLFDSGVGDISRIIIFATPKMLSILRESQNWNSPATKHPPFVFCMSLLGSVMLIIEFSYLITYLEDCYSFSCVLIAAVYSHIASVTRYLTR